MIHLAMESQYYINNFMVKYLSASTEVPNKYYLIYNKLTNKISFNYDCEMSGEQLCIVELFDDMHSFDIFVCNSPEINESFAELLPSQIAEKRIHEYYNFFEANMDVFQKYVVVTNCHFQKFDLTITEFYSNLNPQLDVFEILHFEIV